MTTTRTTTAAPTTSRSHRLRRLAFGLLATGAAVAAVPGVAGAVPQIGDKLGCPSTEIRVKPGQTVVHGTCGNDLIFLYDNAVTVYAGDGDDEIRSGWGGKTVTLYLGNGNDTVSTGSDKRVVAFGEAGDDELEGGQLDDVLHGGKGNDDLIGGIGTNVLSGGEGSDLLDSSTWKPGEQAPDWVYGGAGADISIFEPGDHLDGVEAASPAN